MKQVVINFSELTAEAKRKYLQFLADNNIKVNEENQTIQVRVPKASMPQQHRARQYSTLTDIRNCKAFTPAKATKQVLKAEVSVGPKFSDLIENYPLIMAKIPNKDLLSRPLKMTQHELLNQIEEIYQRKFLEDSALIAKNLPPQDISLQDYVYDFLMKKLKHSRHQQIINFLSSVDLFASKRRDVATFQSFLRIQRQEALTFYLFLRAVIQKEIHQPFYHPLRKQPLDLCAAKLSTKQIQTVCSLVFDGLKNLNEYKSLIVNGLITISDFMHKSLFVFETVNTQNRHSGFKEAGQVSNINDQALGDDSELSEYDNILKKIQSQKDMTQFQLTHTPPLFYEQAELETNGIEKETQEWGGKGQLPEVKFRFKNRKPQENEIEAQVNDYLEEKITKYCYKI